MPNVLNDCEIILYADDALTYIADIDRYKTDIDNVNTWLTINKLKLNESESKIMEIKINSDINFEINDKEIEKLNQIKYLGFIIDNNLNLKSHIDFICKKLGENRFFKRLRKNTNVLTAINMYKTMIKPHFEFGSTIMYSCCANQQIEKLQRLQNKAMRVILRCN